MCKAVLINLSMLMKRSIFFLLLLFSIANCIAQTKNATELENDLMHEYLKLEAYSDTNYYFIPVEDSIFRTKFFNNIQKNPSTLNYPFKKLNNKLYVVTSDDSLFRIYSWDTWSGGTMHFFNNIFQFKSGKNVYTKLLFDSTGDEGGDPLSFYSDIFRLQVGQKIYYLCINNGMYSTKDVSESIKIFSIENDNLNDTVRLIKTNSGLQNEINVEYDFLSVVDRPERPLRVIKYDPSKKIIYIPIVEDDGKVTNRFIKYQFNGKYFERIKL